MPILPPKAFLDFEMDGIMLPSNFSPKIKIKGA
jgi:hypothetical protein